jgi:hypothetical protein
MLRQLARFLILASVITVLTFGAYRVGEAFSAGPPLRIRNRPSGVRLYRRRPLGPQLARTTSFAGEVGLIVGLAFIGRKFLKLRL